MADLTQVFNYDTVPENEFQTLAPGVYRLMVTGESVRQIGEDYEVKKEWKQSDSVSLGLEFVVTDGDHAGRKLRERLTLQTINPSPNMEIAVKIGQQKLKQICDALGWGGLADSSDLLQQELLADVGLQKNKPEYNEIKKFLPLPAKPKAVAQPPQPARKPVTPPPAMNKPRPGFAKRPTQDEVPFDS